MDFNNIRQEHPRQEHPRPQFRREGIKNLNGVWDYAFFPEGREADTVREGASGNAEASAREGASGSAGGLGHDPAGVNYDRQITVPFCPESDLSGIGFKGFIKEACYRREICLDDASVKGVTRLHFGACDYETFLYVNGKYCGAHRGGYCSFFVDVTAAVHPGNNIIEVYVKDDTRSPVIPSGKQSNRLESYGCVYTRTTGIWQTVWLEFLPLAHAESVKYRSDVKTPSVSMELTLCGAADLSVTVSFAGNIAGRAFVADASGVVSLNVPLSETHLWDVGCGNLYDVRIEFGDDIVDSYFGLREVRYDGYKFLLNGRSVFQRLVLDQGFYPDGIYTAPDDSALLNDVKLAKAFGFNGARLHQKVFEERYLYHADREGFLLWGEFPSWGISNNLPEAYLNLISEWTEVLKRDANHPAIITWCPLNETWDDKDADFYAFAVRTLYNITREIDPTRPVVDASGGVHILTDVFDLHDYEQDPAAFAAKISEFNDSPDAPIPNMINDAGAPYVPGTPVNMSEYGGTRWTREMAESEDGSYDNAETSWGYGKAPANEQVFRERFKGLTDALLDSPKLSGFCYTQLTDVEQEQNGCYFYDRSPKFKDVGYFKDVLSRKAAIED
ncbi:MAG: beta-galactosidase [Clostridia bacterium]|nr:beta-galactosidase [Clostridia bacterium]